MSDSDSDEDFLANALDLVFESMNDGETTSVAIQRLDDGGIIVHRDTGTHSLQLIDVETRYDDLKDKPLHDESLFGDPRKPFNDKTLTETRPDGVYVHNEADDGINSAWAWDFHGGWEGWHTEHGYRAQARTMFELFEPLDMYIPASGYRESMADMGYTIGENVENFSFLIEYEVEAKDERIESVLLKIKNNMWQTSVSREVRIPAWNYHYGKQFKSETMLNLFEMWMALHEVELIEDLIDSVNANDSRA